MWMLLWMLGCVDVDVKIPMSMKRKKLPGQEVMHKHASFPGVGTHCGAGKDAQPTQEAKQGEWRGAHRQHGAHVHE